ncbi:MAG: S26 family signal peptidase, partial [Planctomycetota bacterium]
MTDAGAPVPTPPTDGGERLLEILGAGDDPAEQPHAEWRRRLHRFCENWIFALIIAFGIRHFCLEMFRIPSASMEPMLLGDPGLGKGDFVLVDKLTPRFRAPKRWDVTVFQYPVPEIDSSMGQRARPAMSANDERLDDPLWRPLQGSNFVKRLCLMPGEQFYIRSGDIFIGDGAGQWTIPRKPADLQEHLWMPVLRAGEQAGYRPWEANGSATLDSSGPASGLHMTLGDGGSVRLTQPLRNLYLKEGSVAIKDGLDPSGAYVRIDGVSMTRPQFTWPANGKSGSIWDLDRWELKRLTSADQDDPTRGTQINALMTEWVGDVNVSFHVDQLVGTPRLRLANTALGAATPSRTLDLVLSAAGWRIEGGGAAAGIRVEGSASLVGHHVSYAHVDGQVVLRIDDQEVARQDVAWVDPNALRPDVAWHGSGEIAVSQLTIGCDLHYSKKGFLTEPPNPDQVRQDLRT